MEPQAPLKLLSPKAELAEGFARVEADLAAGAIARKPTPGDFIVFERGV